MALPEERSAEAIRQQVVGSASAAPLAFTPAGDVAPNAHSQADWRSFVRSMVLGGAVALGGWYIVTRFLPTAPRAHLGAVGRRVLMVSVLVAASAAPLAHELGHVLGGVLVRFCFTMLVWGPLRVVREGGRIRFGLNRSLAYAGGIALSLPQTMEHLPRRTAVVIAMGPLTSLVLGILFLLASQRIGIWSSPAAMRNPILAILGIAAAAFGVSSLGIALVTLMPGRTGGMSSDGAQIVRFVRGGPVMERHSALLALAGLSMGPTPPRELPNALIDRLIEADATECESAMGHTLAYYKALDAGDVPRAHTALTDVLARTVPRGRKARAPYAQEAAFYELVIRGDVDAVERWLREEAMGSESEAPMRAVLLDAIVLARDSNSTDATAVTSARSRIEAALPAIAARSGADALKTELLMGFIGRVSSLVAGAPRDDADGVRRRIPLPPL